MADIRVSFPKPCTESWESMKPVGGDRFCGRCRHVVHDLADKTIDEIEALLSSPGKVCAKARVGRNGRIDLKAATVGNRLAAAAAAGMLIASAPAGAARSSPHGTIVGTIPGAMSETIVATGADGVEYRSKLSYNGRYRIKRLPPGEYRLTLRSDCDDENTAPRVMVRAGEVVTAPSIDYGCVVVGMISRDTKSG